MVSIIIPCYNCSAFVSRAIESVFKQTLSNWELILVNNNSTDDTQAVLSRYCETYPEFISSIIELKPGAPAARNAGLRQAVGDWIQFLDADDELMPEKIARQLEIARDGSFDVISGAYLSSRTVGGAVVEKLRLPRMENVWESLISSKLGITSANLWKKEALLKVYGWDESLSSSQEYDLLFRLLTVNSRIGFDFSPHTIIYSLENSVSNTTSANRLEKIMDDRINLRLRMKNFLLNEGLYTQEMSAFFDSYLYRLLIRRRHLIPEYVSRRLRELSLNVPLKERITLQTKIFLKQLLGRNP
ncbi:glycosyltransferase family 2 protein [Arcticibacter sp.]|uniref:glycosyltransferase family 2 protein n=1 Tax=Arcticibacter sp. TaxID=1872630 RepID=UPI003890EE91